MKKILIADDEYYLRIILKDLLNYSNYKIYEAKNGEEALEIAVKEKPDIILLDISMPKMNGYEVMIRLREKNIQSKIIVISAKAQKTDKEKGLALGADYYITKPFDIIRLSDLIDEI